MTKTEKLKNTAFRSVRADEPRRVERTRREKGAAAAERQIRAIALAKARAAGARIPKP